MCVVCASACNWMRWIHINSLSFELPNSSISWAILEQWLRLIRVMKFDRTQLYFSFRGFLALICISFFSSHRKQNYKIWLLGLCFFYYLILMNSCSVSHHLLWWFQHLWQFCLDLLEQLGFLSLSIWGAVCVFTGCTVGKKYPFIAGYHDKSVASS